jgi:NAD(P)-dependent dehydrogenase (short-subunit alcohol dehydrogenase family)
MKTLEGKVAVITGGAGGLGMALARQCAGRGMKLVLADVERGALEAAGRALGSGVECVTCLTDVTRRESLDALATLAYQRFGGVHLLFNNAGVSVSKSVAETTANDWTWVLGVNLWGVLHGIQAFLPRMEAQQEECRIVNTASAAGFLTDPGMAAYSVSKHAVVVVSETLDKELRARSSKVGVTMLCPAYFSTGIGDAERNRPPELASPPPSDADREVRERLGAAIRKGRLGADDIARMALEAILAGELYLFTHKKIRLAFEERFRHILDACPYTPTR